MLGSKYSSPKTVIHIGTSASSFFIEISLSFKACKNIIILVSPKIINK